MTDQPFHGPANYALEKLLAAMHGMATGPGDVRERLESAFLSSAFLKEDDFPKHLRADWRWIVDQMTKFGPAYDHTGKKMLRGSVEETMKRIKRATGVKIAEKLAHVYHELDAYVNPR